MALFAGPAVVALNAVTGVSTGDVFQTSGQPAKLFTMVKTFTGGTFTTYSAALEGSLDNIAWFTLGTDSTITSGNATFVVDKPANFFRVKINTYTAASGTPAVTAKVVAS